MVGSEEAVSVLVAESDLSDRENVNLVKAFSVKGKRV